MKNNIQNSNFLKLYFIIGSAVIILFFVLYTNTLLFKVRKELEILPKIYAELLEGTTKENFESFLMNYFLNEFPQKINYPMIISTEKNIPKYWKNINITQKPFEKLSQNEKNKLGIIFNEMIKSETSITLKNPKTEELICKIYYSESATMKKLKFLPYFEFLVLILFIAIGTLEIVLMKKREKESLWIALAKETAHQFGTPITSLLGWIEVLNSKNYKNSSPEKQSQILDQIKLDVQHLQNTASRFGKVGSTTQLKKSDLDKTITEIIDYFTPRIPKDKHMITLSYIKRTSHKLFYFDPDLLQWALENLIKNSIDAMKNKSGNISVITYEKGEKVFIQVKDEGIGIPKKLQKVIFNTGVTTKNRGWGIGLSLAKRIIEEFHNGKIYLLKSNNSGTIFEIVLPKNN
ncbi:MAG: HAMP domain-containing histidine kinase [Candidatus Cloacimonetes bacterium]|nr:HAMP domain-containing histidine kinase [Candidatus Cloacimonadota bacterium]